MHRHLKTHGFPGNSLILLLVLPFYLLLFLYFLIVLRLLPTKGIKVKQQGKFYTVV